MSRNRRAARCWLLFLLVSVVHLVADLLGHRLWAGVTLVLVMPTLATYLLAACAPWRARIDGSVDPGRRLTGLVLVALGFSWLGDMVNTVFLLKLLAFLAAQLCYVLAFWPDRGRSILRRPAPLTLYLLVVGLLVVVVALHAGGLAPAVVVYGVSLGLMAVLATGVDRLAGLGGAVFVVSDAVLALTTFLPTLHLPAPTFLVMATYLSGQGLIVRGVVRRCALGFRLT